MPGEARDIKVTRSLVIGADPVGGRLAEERRILALHFPGFVLDSTTARAGTWAVARGPLRTFAGTRYDIRIDLPDGYPHSLPRVWPHGWTPVKNPHMYADGTICVMRRRQWSSFFSAAAVVAKAAIWLNKYEIWVERQVWPGPQQPH
ncbi:ubiquitin-conjugating enzyme E2 [Streptomyces sp. NBC_00080]|uniref:ubiquitin-conjugating enzyme E2 variant n=1 Tax=Streptomyces TaxID=1883 RepID=UPI001E3BB6D3|nr:ubiquitin-conjugating enzyme E2 [Streptomyces coriariae]